MKIQIATNTIVETYNATDDGKLALKAVRIPLRGDEAEVRLTVSCRGAGPTWNQFCRDREVRVYEGYLDFLRTRVQP